MANSTSITRWIIDNRSIIHPNYTEFDWPNRYYHGLYDFSAEIKIGGAEGSGRGIDCNRELALEKASAEAIERLICQSLDISTKGVAVSGSLNAMAHADNEALERFFFEEHISNQRPFNPLADDTIAAERKIRSSIRVNDTDLQMSFAEMATPKSYYGVVCFIRVSQTPIALGLSLCRTPEDAVNKAFTEAFANYARFKDSPESFARSREQMTHVWNINTTYLSQVESLLSAVENDRTPFSTPLLRHETLDYGFIKELATCPITPVRSVAHRINI